MVKDLTVGSPPSVLFKYSLPILGSVAFQQLYNLMDGVIAGKFIGDDALAAVGASYPITMIFMAVAFGLNGGVSVLVSQIFGGKRMEEMKTAAFTSLISAVLISLALTLVGEVFCNPLLRLISTPDNIFADSALYLRIYVGGLLFVFLYNICNGIFNALGDSTTPFIFLVVSSLGNIVLDLLFVISFHMGVGGVGWATLVAQGVAAVIAFFVLLRRLKHVPSGAFAKFSVPVFMKMVQVSVPSILQQSCVSIGNMFIQNFVNGYGSTVIAGYSAAIKFNTFALMVFNAFSTALSSFVAQNFGAGKMERIKDGVKACLLLTLCFVIPITLCFAFLGGSMMHIFVNADSVGVIEVGKTFMRWTSPFYIVVTTKVVFDSTLRGAAAMKYFMVTTFADLILRITFAWILKGQFGPTGIWMAWPFGWSCGMALSLFFYFKCDWRHHHVKI